DAVRGVPAFLRQSGPPQRLRLGTDKGVAAEPLELRAAPAVEQLVVRPVGRGEQRQREALPCCHDRPEESTKPSPQQANGESSPRPSLLLKKSRQGRRRRGSASCTIDTARSCRGRAPRPACTCGTSDWDTARQRRRAHRMHSSQEPPPFPPSPRWGEG